MKRENISSLQADSQNLRGNPHIKDSQGGLPRSHSLARNDDSFLDSATRTPLISFDSFAKRAAPPVPLPLRAKKLRFFAFRGRASLSPLLAKNRRTHFCNLAPDFLHHEAGEFGCFARILKKFLLLLAFAKSRIPLNFIDFNQLSRADSQNLAINFLKG